MERALSAVKLKIASLEFLERDVRLRMPFRFGVITLTESPQVFVRCRIRTEQGIEAEGAAAELLAPKWFDKNPRYPTRTTTSSCAIRCVARARRTSATRRAAPGRIPRRREGLVENYGPALIDRAMLDALCRALGISFYTAIQKNVIGAESVRRHRPASFFSRLAPKSSDRCAPHGGPGRPDHARRT